MTTYVRCKQTVTSVEKTHFKKGKWYKAKWVHDLLQFKGEEGYFIQIEQVDQNEWFHEHFAIVTMENQEAVLQIG